MVTDNMTQADDKTAFLRAARSGNLEKVIEYLDTDLDINAANSNGLNALHLASKDGHVEIVTELLKRGAKIDAATKKGNTALHIASLAGQSEIVNILLRYGSTVNIQSQNGFTPLYMAAQENHDQVVKILLCNGANQSLATEDGFTPLAVAMQQGHDKVVSVLLENDSKGKVRLPALHIAAKKDDCKAADLLLQNDHKPDVTSKSGFTPLHIAAHYGNEEIARLLIKRGADVNYLAKHNISPLHVAAKWGKNNMVKILLENSASIDAKTRDGLTPLHCAARSGHDEVVGTLLESSAPISARTKNGLAPLHMASQGDHVDAARVLLYHRAPVDEVTIDYLTSLHVAAHCGHVRVAKLLLERKADANARALNGFTPLHIACKKNRIKVVELLIKHGASIESTTESGLTPLHVASFMGCMNIVIFLLQHEANPDVPTVRGETPLHLAARANQTDIIRILLRNGAKVDARAREQQTPLHIASRLGNVDIVMLLLQHGATVDTPTKDMYTALHIAAKEGQEEVAAILVENNASTKATTKNGFTPLHIAAKYGNINVAKILLQKDSAIDAQGKNEITALHMACHYDHPSVATLLLDKGASPHVASQNGHTPLHTAARKNQMDIASTLLEHGADANVESKAGFTPLHLSAQKGHYDMTNLLIEHGANPNAKAKNGLTALHLCAQEDFIRVASILVKNGADLESETETGYRPIHVASHFGNLSMIRFLLKHNASIDVTNQQNYTPLHQAAQQGHAHVASALLDGNASHKARTTDGLTALNIAQKLGYISVMEVLKGLSYDNLAPNNKNWEDKYKVIAPESLQEANFMSDSDDEGGSDTLINEQPYRYLTADLMKSLRDDSLPIDVTRDDPIDRQVSKEDRQEFVQSSNYCSAENFEMQDSLTLGRMHLRSFLVSFLVDARGGAMKGCRHSGIRIIVPPRRATMPIRVTCRLVKHSKIANPPSLMEGESLATRIIEMGPIAATFLGPVLIDVPHFASARGKEREIIILRSENGETWKEHDNSSDNDDTLANTAQDPQMSAAYSGRITRIITTEFPQYFAIVTRIRQEVHVIGSEGGILMSSVVNHVQAVFPPGALTKKIKVGLQAHVIPAELTAKLLGNCVAVSPVITIEPRRRKFHKPITLTIPVPQAANKGMINQYGGETPTLRLLCSIAGGTSEAQWEDVTGSTPLTFLNDERVSFTTTVSARFWLMDCRNVGEVPKMATELYRESLFVPFITNFVIYSKRMDLLEATLRILCMTEGKEGLHTLERQEEFLEIVKSRDVEALDGKDLYIEFSGNLIPVTKSGVQLKFTFRAFRQNRLSFHVKVKDPLLDPVARMLFMKEPKVPKGEAPQQPICILNIVLPEIMQTVASTEKKNFQDSNIIAQKLDVDKSKREAEGREKSDDPKMVTSPSEKMFLNGSAREDAGIIHESFAQKVASPIQSVDASCPQVKLDVREEEEAESPVIEKQTYSEKRKFWEDITKKREDLERSESEISKSSQLTVGESESEAMTKEEVQSEEDTDFGISARSETMEDVNVPDISECSVAEKAHYFEEQIQRETSMVKSIVQSTTKTSTVVRSKDAIGMSMEETREEIEASVPTVGGIVCEKEETRDETKDVEEGDEEDARNRKQEWTKGVSVVDICRDMLEEERKGGVSDSLKFTREEETLKKVEEEEEENSKSNLQKEKTIPDKEVLSSVCVAEKVKMLKESQIPIKVSAEVKSKVKSQVKVEGKSEIEKKMEVRSITKAREKTEVELELKQAAELDEEERIRKELELKQKAELEEKERIRKELELKQKAELEEKERIRKELALQQKAEAEEKERIKKELDMKRKAEREEKERIQKELELTQKAEAEEKERVRKELELKQKAELEEKKRIKKELEMKEKAELEEKERIKKELELKQKAEAEEKERIKKELELKQKAEAEEKERIKKELELKQKAEAEEKERIKKELELKQKAELEEKERIKKELELKQKADAEEKERIKKELEMKRKAELEEKERIQKQLESKQKAEAEEKERVRKELELKQKFELEEKERIKKELVTKEKAELEEKERIKKELESKQKEEAEEKERIKKELELKQKAEAEEKGRVRKELEMKEKAELEEKERLKKELELKEKTELEEKERMKKELEIKLKQEENEKKVEADIEKERHLKLKETIPSKIPVTSKPKDEAKSPDMSEKRKEVQSRIPKRISEPVKSESENVRPRDVFEVPRGGEDVTKRETKSPSPEVSSGSKFQTVKESFVASSESTRSQKMLSEYSEAYTNKFAQSRESETSKLFQDSLSLGDRESSATTRTTTKTTTRSEAREVVSSSMSNKDGTRVELSESELSEQKDSESDESKVIRVVSREKIEESKKNLKSLESKSEQATSVKLEDNEAEIAAFGRESLTEERGEYSSRSLEDEVGLFVVESSREESRGVETKVGLRARADLSDGMGSFHPEEEIDKSRGEPDEVEKRAESGSDDSAKKNEARNIAETIIQSIEAEIDARSIMVEDYLGKVVPRSKEESRENRMSVDSTKLESFQESMSISEDITKDEESYGYGKDQDSSGLKLNERDMMMSPSTISDQTEMEDSMEVEGNLVDDTKLAEVEVVAPLQGRSMEGIVSDARVLEIIEPVSKDLGDSESIRKELEITIGKADPKRVEEVASSLDNSFGKIYSDRDITVSPSTVSEQTDIEDSSLVLEPRTKKEYEMVIGRGGDVFEVESSPMASSKTSVKSLDIKPVDWMIGDEKIEISESVQPSQAFDRELEEYEIIAKQASVEEVEPEVEDEGRTSLGKSVPPRGGVVPGNSKFTVIPVSDKQLESELVENNLGVSCQELLDILRKEFVEETSREAETGTTTESIIIEESSKEIVHRDEVGTLKLTLKSGTGENGSRVEVSREELEGKRVDADRREEDKVAEEQKWETEVEEKRLIASRYPDESKSGNGGNEKVEESSGKKLELDETTRTDYDITVLDQAVQKEIAEVKESLEAAKQDLIEELNEHSETVFQIKDSPSEFQFKLQPESIPEDSSFLYESEPEGSSGMPVAKPRRIQDDEVPNESGPEESSGFVKIPEKPIASYLEDDPEDGAVPIFERCHLPRNRSEEDPEDLSLPVPASRSGSDLDTKEDPFSVVPPQPAPRRRQKPARTPKKGRNEIDVDVNSSSGESNYQSCDYEIGSGSRPSSSDFEAMISGFPSGTASEYDTALTSADHSSASRPTSQDYQTAVSSLSSRESMKSLNSESSGHLASIESSSELSETLVASEAELDKDNLDESVEYVLEDDPAGSTTSKSFPEALQGDESAPCRMKRSSEMIFQRSEDGTAAQQTEMPGKTTKSPTKDEKVPTDLKLKTSSDNATSTPGAGDSPGSLRSVDLTTSRVEEDGIRSVCTQVTSREEEDRNGKPEERLEESSKFSTSVDRSDSGTGIATGTKYEESSLVRQTSMSTSSTSGMSLETVIDKEKNDRKSPDSDSFELVDKPDIIDDFVVIEEVGREAEEFDSEGKSIRITGPSTITKKLYDREVENLIAEKEDSRVSVSQASRSNDLFDFESEESPPQLSNEDQYSRSLSDEEQYENNKKWVEMQFQPDNRGYDVDCERRPLEDIKEEEIADFEPGSSRFGSLGSQKESVGSVGSMKGSLGSTPDYDVLAGRKYFTKSSEYDNLSLSSLQEFENLETAMAMENARRLQCGSSDSTNGSLPRRYLASRSGHGDDVSLSSLKDFEGLESACREAHMIELRAREEEDLLDHESPENRYKLETLARSRNNETSAPGSFNPSTSGSDDYEKRIREIDEIIRIAQSNVEKFDRQDDTTDDVSQIEVTDTEGKGMVSLHRHTSMENIDEPHRGTNPMETSTDSLELEDPEDPEYRKRNPLCRSSDSLEMKTNLDLPSLSSDSLNNARDSIQARVVDDQFNSASRRLSSDSLETSFAENQITFPRGLDESNSNYPEMVDNAIPTTNSGQGSTLQTISMKTSSSKNGT